MKEIAARFWMVLKQSTALKVIVAAEAVMIVLLAANCFRARCDYAYSWEDFYITSDLVQEVTDSQGRAGLYVNEEENIEETTILTTDLFRLYPGAYKISIEYRSQVNYEEEGSIVYGNGYLYLDNQDDEIYLNFESMFLRNGMDSNESTFQVTAPLWLDDLQLSVTFYGLGEMAVYSVEIVEIVAYRYVCLLGAVCLFVLLDLIGFFLFVDRNYKWKKELGILVLICVGACLPFIADYVITGHDTGFHTYRILLLAHELARGNLFPAIYTAGLNGYGYPAPLLYGQLLLYIPAALYNCGFSLVSVYNFYLCVLSIATCLITYDCSLKIFKRTKAALLCTALYTLSAVRLTNILTRAALGEAAAQTFLPLLVLGFYEIYTAPKGEKITVRKYWPIIVGLTGILTSHTLTTLMCAMVILAVCLILIRKTLEPQRLFALIKAALLSLMLNLSTLVPMLDSMRMDMNVNHVVNYIQTTGAYLIQIFNSVVNNYQEYQEADTAANELSLSIGFSLTLGLAFYFVYLVRQKRVKDRDERTHAFASLCFGLCAVTIFLSTTYMFYDYLNFLPESLYSILTVYQYPWRWLSFAALFGAFGVAAIADSGELGTVLKGVSVTMLLVVALVINVGQIYADQLRTSELTRWSNNLSDYYYMVGSSGEYLLYGTDISQILAREPGFYGEGLTVYEYECDDGEAILQVENTSMENAVIDLPLFHYDNYIAYDTETGESISITTGENNRIRLHVPAGYKGTVKVEYHFRKLWLLAIGVSVVTMTLLIGYAVFSKKKESKGQ